MYGSEATPEQHTAVLGSVAASAAADPGALTEVLVRPASAESDPGLGRRERPDQAWTALVSRQVAAELGLYVGALLILAAFVGAALRGWAGWDPTMRGTAVTLTSIALIATGLFVRLPWRRRTSPQRRRAVSVLLTAGLALAAVGSAVGLEVGQGAERGSAALHVGAVAVTMGLACLVARTPFSETGVLVALAWAIWVLVPAGEGTWLGLVLLGLAWAAAGFRWARGRRTALAAGVAIALAASVGLAQGTWGWGVRGALLAAAVVGLVRFLRGASNAWLALGIGAATACAAAVAGGALSPALALMVAGVTTMAVSGLAMLGARE